MLMRYESKLRTANKKGPLMLIFRKINELLLSLSLHLQLIPTFIKYRGINVNEIKRLREILQIIKVTRIRPSVAA